MYLHNYYIYLIYLFIESSCWVTYITVLKEGVAASYAQLIIHFLRRRLVDRGREANPSPIVASKSLNRMLEPLARRGSECIL